MYLLTYFQPEAGILVGGMTLSYMSKTAWDNRFYWRNVGGHAYVKIVFFIYNCTTVRILWYKSVKYDGFRLAVEYKPSPYLTRLRLDGYGVGLYCDSQSKSIA